MHEQLLYIFSFALNNALDIIFYKTWQSIPTQGNLKINRMFKGSIFDGGLIGFGTKF